MEDIPLDGLWKQLISEKPNKDPVTLTNENVIDAFTELIRESDRNLNRYQPRFTFEQAREFERLMKGQRF